MIRKADRYFLREDKKPGSQQAEVGVESHPFETRVPPNPGKACYDTGKTLSERRGATLTQKYRRNFVIVDFFAKKIGERLQLETLFWEQILLEVSIARDFGALKGLRLYNWKPFSGTKILEVSILRDFGALQGLRLYNWKPFLGGKLTSS